MRHVFPAKEHQSRSWDQDVTLGSAAEGDVQLPVTSGNGTGGIGAF